jgi:hypothetical protein
MKNSFKRFCIVVTSLIIIAVTVFILAAKPRIVLNGPNVTTIRVSEEYDDAGASAYIYNIDFTNMLTTTSNVDTSKEGTYTVEYSLRYRNKLISASRVVYVIAE